MKFNRLFECFKNNKDTIFGGFSGRPIPTPSSSCSDTKIHKEIMLSGFNIVDSRVKHEDDRSGLESTRSTPSLSFPRRRESIATESGRSMVEMLGVLALIGVLSIGGIAGYNYAINKWRANVTINDVNLRAMDLISQLSQGYIPTLNDWETTSTAKYPISLNSDLAPTHYYIKVEKVPFKVCDIIAQNMPESVEIMVDNDTYSCADGENTMDFAYEGFAVGEKCGDTVCTECQKCENESCVTVSDYEQKCTANDGKYGWCVSGTCEPDGCDCGENQYCADTSEDACSPHPSGTCKDLTYSEYTIDGTTYYVSDNHISWWDAASFCKALGKNMINNLYDFVQNCDNSDDTDCNNGQKLSSLGVELYRQSGKWGVWSSVLNGSCIAKGVYFGGNRIDQAFRRDRQAIIGYALCK